MGRLEGARQIAEQIVENPRQRGCSRDQNIVMPPTAMKGQQGRSRCPQTPLGAVARHGIADFAASGEADPDPVRLCGIFGCLAQFQGQSGRRAADSTSGAQEIGADFQAIYGKPLGGAGLLGCLGAVQAESFLRPWARRRARTLRPPAVDMRERKP